MSTKMKSVVSKRAVQLTDRYAKEMEKIGLKPAVIISRGDSGTHNYLNGSSMLIGSLIRELLVREPSILAGASAAALMDHDCAVKKLKGKKVTKSKK